MVGKERLGKDRERGQRERYDHRKFDNLSKTHKNKWKQLICSK